VGGIDGRIPGGMQMEMQVPTFVVKLEDAGFKYMISPNGEDGEIRILFMHPLFPVRFDIPFTHFIFMERFADDVNRWIERAKDAQETTSA